MHFNRQISADVLSRALNAVEDGIKTLGLERSFRAKPRVEIAGVPGHFRQRIVHLVIKQHVFVVGVLHRDPRRLAERHGPVTVERAPGIHANRQRADLTVFSPTASEEVAHRRLYRRVSFTIPVAAENGMAPVARRRHPNVIDATRPLDVGQCEGRSSLDDDRGRDFPALAQLTRRLLSGALGRHSAFAFFTSEILRTDGTGQSFGSATKIRQRAGRWIGRVCGADHRCGCN